jgi:hypothetical protein
MSFIDAENLFKDIAESVRKAYDRGEINDLGEAMRRVEKMEVYFRGDYAALWRMERDERLHAEAKMNEQRMKGMLQRMKSAHELSVCKDALRAATASESEISSVHEAVHPACERTFKYVLNPEDISTVD